MVSQSMDPFPPLRVWSPLRSWPSRICLSWLPPAYLWWLEWLLASPGTLFSSDNYYISKLLRALWLVNLADRTFLHGPLRCKVSFVAKLCVIYYQIFSTCETNNSLKLFFTSNCVLKHANDFKLNRFAFDLVQKFEAVSHEWKSFPDPSDTQ